MFSRSMVLVLLVLPAAASAQTAPQPVVLKGLELLAAGHCRDGIGAWTSSWTGQDAALKRTQLLNSCDFLDQMGSVSGYDVLRTVDVTRHLQRVYIVLRTDVQPVYFMVLAYAPKDEWKINTVNWNTDPDKVIPADVLPAQNPGR